MHLLFSPCSRCCVIQPPNPVSVTSQICQLETLALPHVLIWCPLTQFSIFFQGSIQCPNANCNKIIGLSRWNVGHSDGHCPRLLHDLNNMVLLVPAVYACDNGHETVATDPYILQKFPEEEHIPFILFHRSGVIREFARIIIGLSIEGLSFSAAERFIKTRRNEFIASLLLRINSIYNPSELDIKTISSLYNRPPSNDLLTNCFLQNFFEHKCEYFKAMEELLTSEYLSFDHTFKVAANLGYLRPDKKWIPLYSSLFIILNDVGQVIAWQFTQSTAVDETGDLLSSVAQRLLSKGIQLKAIYVDNCCIVRNKLQGYFGSCVSIKLDIFHAIQRLTRVLSKKHPLYYQILKDVKLIFRDPRDTGKERTLQTPDPKVLCERIDTFLAKWNEAEIQGSFILNAKAKKELHSLRTHASKGCLSEIPPGAGTNRNENLHRKINPFFCRCRFGVPLALALLTMLFHQHNNKKDPTLSILSAKASYKTSSSISNEHHAKFGIINKTEIPYINSWVFGTQTCGTMPKVSLNELTEVHLNAEIEELVSLDDLFSTVKSTLQLWELSKKLQTYSKHSLLLNTKMIPFMSSVSCLFEPTDKTPSVVEQHKRRLLDVVESWGFQLHPVEGDGNCFFSAIAFAICVQREQIECKKPDHLVKHGIEKMDIGSIAIKIRQMVVDEWMSNADEYQKFIGNEHSVTEEAPKFLQQGYFFGPMGNTMVLAVSNALGIPIVVFSSANHYPIINITPRVCEVPIPLYIAFNQPGAGHYDSVSLTGEQHKKLQHVHETKCNCGKNKPYSTTERCNMVHFKYTVSIHCPCLLAESPCTSTCKCLNCTNPKGVRPKHLPNRVRERRTHAWKLKPVKSLLYTNAEQENILTGPRTQLEYLLIAELIKLCNRSDIEAEYSIIHQLYLTCFDLMQEMDPSWPIAKKSMEEITKIVKEYDQHRRVFEATCIAQLKINIDPSK